MYSGIVIGLMLIWMISAGAWHNVIVLLALLAYVATIGADNHTFAFGITLVVAAVMAAMQWFGPRREAEDDDAGEDQDR